MEKVKLSPSQYQEFFSTLWRCSSEYKVALRNKRKTSLNPYERKGTSYDPFHSHFHRVMNHYITRCSINRIESGDIAVKVPVARVMVLKSPKDNMIRFTGDIPSMFSELHKYSSGMSHFTGKSVSLVHTNNNSVGIFKDEFNIYRKEDSRRAGFGFLVINGKLLHGSIVKMGELPVCIKVVHLPNFESAVVGSVLLHLVKNGELEEFVYPELDIQYEDENKSDMFLKAYSEHITVVKEV